MVLPVDERQGLTHQLQNVCLAAHGIEFVDASQVIDERDGVDGDAAVVHIDHRGIDGLMNGPVEVIGLQLDLGLFDYLGRQQHSGQYIGLCVLVLRETQLRATVLDRQSRLPVVICHEHPHSYRLRASIVSATVPKRAAPRQSSPNETDKRSRIWNLTATPAMALAERRK